MGLVRAARNNEYGPGGDGTRKSSIWIRLAMVFRMVREGGQKQGIWAGERREAKIIDLDFIQNPNLIQNPFSSHSELILNPCRNHSELFHNSTLIENSFRSHLEHASDSAHTLKHNT